MKLSREEVLRVAELAHLKLTDEEMETYGRQLDSILTYVEKLNELDTEGVEPMAQVLAAGSEDPNPALRDDLPRRDEVADAALKVAPDPGEHFFRVPKVIER